MIILGIDPGAMLGWCCWDSDLDAPLDGVHGEIQYEGRSCRTVPDRAIKMREMWWHRFRELKAEYGVEWVAIERQISRSNSADAALHSYSTILRGTASQQGLSTIEVPISQVKKTFAGTGRASKEQIQAVVRLKYRRIFREHEADALAIAVAAYPLILNRLGKQAFGALVV